MGWKKTSEGKGAKGKYVVYKETILTTQATNLASAGWSSEIDFIPPGTDFQVISNTAGTDLSISTHVELWVAYSKGAAVSARHRLIQTPFITLTSELDTKTPVMFRDISTYGQFPYYYLKIPSGGDSGINTGVGTMENVIIVGRGSTEIIA